MNCYLDAVVDAEKYPDRASIVNGSIASALEGRFGNVHRSVRTSRSQLFINPLMTFLWAFELRTVARCNLYLGRLVETQTLREVLLLIEEFHASVKCQPRLVIPH